jgi:hypothetical protein
VRSAGADRGGQCHVFTAGATGYGAAEYGEVATAFNGVHHGGNSYNAFYDNFCSMVS